MQRDLPIAYVGFLVVAAVCGILGVAAAANGMIFWALIAGAGALGSLAIAALLTRPGVIEQVEELGPKQMLSPQATDVMEGENFISPEPPPPGRDRPGLR